MAEAGERRVRLMPDYSAEWPLWTDGMISGATLGLSPDLQRALQEWATFFDAHFHHERGWDAPTHRTAFAHHGHELLWWLRAELPDLEVEYDDWATA